VSDTVQPALAPEAFVLPPRLIGRSHISRVLREVEAVDTYMASQAIRSPQISPVVPGVSRVLRELVEVNRCDLADQKQRQRLAARLRKTKDSAPVAHVTFAIEPDVLILTELTQWLRANVHEFVLVSAGVQPNIIGGCVVRTPDKVYDFSFKKHFVGKQALLSQAIKKATTA
jgi:F0F1-type ATP synthase delta subunit